MCQVLNRLTQKFYSKHLHKRNLANDTGGGGGGGPILTMGNRNFILQRSQIWKREKLFP
jgi:hypothetical protein